MSPPSTQELEDAIVDILTCARNDDKLDQLTVRLVRIELATRFDVEESALNSGIYKSFIKETVHATVNRLADEKDEDVESLQHEAPKKEKSDKMPKTQPRQLKSKAKVHSVEKLTEESDVSEAESAPRKKTSARSKPFKPGVKPSKKLENETKHKSKAIVETSDDEGPPLSGTHKSVPSPKKGKISLKSSPKQKQVNRDNSDAEIDITDGPGQSSPSSKVKRKMVSPRSPKTKEPTQDPMDSELSSVIDEPPKKRQKKQEKESSNIKHAKDQKAKRGKKEVLAKDEETVNRLKSIVAACGVRKVWKKEFGGLDKPSQQIKRLHTILGELGMRPRYSMEKAKAIRDQQELAQELKDVQEFAKAVKRHGKGNRESPEGKESVDECDDDVDVPTRKKQNARASIMAFLQDQSEEE